MNRRAASVLLAVTLLVTATASCSDSPAACENIGTCAPAGGSSSAGSATGGKGGRSGSGSSGKSNAGDGGAGTAGSSMGGSTTGGKGGSSATAGEAGASGGGAMLPCDGACASPKPVCDEPTDTCVECLEEGDCAAGAKKKCDTTAKTCVECLASTECTDATTAKCDSGACVKCTSNDDCAHVAGKTVCDTAAGECVQCTAADENACGGKSCNPLTNACTGTTVGSVGTCKPCVADSECAGGGTADPTARCVQMKFDENQREGGFCMKRVTKGCAAPFTVTFSAASLSGAASEGFCGLNQTNTTCEAVLDLSAGRTCLDGEDTSCGCERDSNGACVASGLGGLCRTVGGVAKSCTYSCGTTAQCPSGTACTIDDPYCH